MPRAREKPFLARNRVALFEPALGVSIAREGPAATVALASVLDPWGSSIRRLRAVDDARPDRWGERVIRFLDKPPRLSLLEYLYFAGDDRFGWRTMGRQICRQGTHRYAAPLIEHASMTLAAKAGIHVAMTMPIRLVHGHAIAIRRFDRAGGRRCHALSANVALKAAGEPMGYPELAQLLRRRGVAEGERNVEQMHELFRRMVFNILLDNTDDHEKNHVLLVTDAAQYELSPAFDVLPSGQALGYQQMRVGVSEADSTIDNALSLCNQFSLKPARALEEVQKVATVVNGWRAHFAAGEPLVNLELHGIDFLSAEDGLEALLGYQPDVRIRASEKRAVLAAVVGRLRKAGHRFVRLDQAVDAPV